LPQFGGSAIGSTQPQRLPEKQLNSTAAQQSPCPPLLLHSPHGRALLKSTPLRFPANPHGSLLPGCEVSAGCCNKLPQTWWHAYSLTVLEATSLKSVSLDHGQSVSLAGSFWSLSGRIYFLAYSSFCLHSVAQGTFL
jgi:hypothetical protein